MQRICGRRSRHELWTGFTNKICGGYSWTGFVDAIHKQDLWTRFARIAWMGFRDTICGQD